MSLTALTREHRWINALSVVPYPQSELLIVVPNFNFDLTSTRVSKGVPQRFGGNLIGLVAKDGVQISRLAFNCYTECRPVVA